MERPLRPVDHAALRANQAALLVLLSCAFVLDASWLVLLVAVVMSLGTLLAKPGFAPLYLLLRRAGLIQPDILIDNPELHRFAQAIGSLVLWIALLGFLLQSAILGWALVWLVIALAGVNLLGGLCVGCALYYWLSRAGLPGFTKAPPPGTAPGRRPPRTGGG
jgi:hypothetical protein